MNTFYNSITSEYNDFKEKYIYDKNLDNIKLKMKQNVLSKIIMESINNKLINVNNIHTECKEIPYEKIYMLDNILNDIYDNNSIPNNALINFLSYFPINIHVILLDCIFTHKPRCINLSTFDIRYLDFMKKYIL